MSLILSGTLFAAHAFPLNEKIIEPAMARHSAGAYVAGFFYYALWLFFPLSLFLSCFGKK